MSTANDAWQERLRRKGGVVTTDSPKAAFMAGAKWALEDAAEQVSAGKASGYLHWRERAELSQWLRDRAAAVGTRTETTMSEPYKYQPDSPHVASSIQTHDDPYRNTRTTPPTADRDDLAAILAKHRFRRMDGEQAECVHGDWTQDEDDYRTDPHDAHRAHVAQMVLESDWLRERDAVKWDEGEKTSDCVCGHNIFAHPKDDWRSCRVAKRGECDCTGFEPAPNPYRAGQEGDHAH